MVVGVRLPSAPAPAAAPAAAPASTTRGAATDPAASSAGGQDDHYTAASANTLPPSRGWVSHSIGHYHHQNPGDRRGGPDPEEAPDEGGPRDLVRQAAPPSTGESHLNFDDCQDHVSPSIDQQLQSGHGRPQVPLDQPLFDKKKPCNERDDDPISPRSGSHQESEDLDLGSDDDGDQILARDYDGLPTNYGNQMLEPDEVLLPKKSDYHEARAGGLPTTTPPPNADPIDDPATSSSEDEGDHYLDFGGTDYCARVMPNRLPRGLVFVQLQNAEKILPLPHLFGEEERGPVRGSTSSTKRKSYPSTSDDDATRNSNACVADCDCYGDHLYVGALVGEAVQKLKVRSRAPFHTFGGTWNGLNEDQKLAQVSRGSMQ